MQQLHLVGFTTDLEGLIFSPRKGAKSGGYFITLDDQLLDSIEDAQRLREERDHPAPPDAQAEAAPAEPPALRRRPKPRSELSPREIQARLRSGASVADVAREAGVDQEWVLRFATPIRAEQARVVEQAQRLTFVKTRLGPSSQNLGASVQWNLIDRGVQLSEDDYEAGWSAFNLHGTTWAVRFTFWSRKRSHTAEWEVDLRASELSARNRLASELGYVEPGRTRKRPSADATSARDASLPDAAESRPARKAPAAKKAQPAKKGKPASKKTASPARSATKRSGDGGPGHPVEAGQNGSATPAPGAGEDERPTHLARPPSPMNTANRAPAQGTGGAAFSRPLSRAATRQEPPAPAQRPPPPAPRPPADRAGEPSAGAGPRSERRPPPPRPGPEGPSYSARRPPPSPAAPETRPSRYPTPGPERRPPEGRTAPEPSPGVVILPAPEAESRAEEQSRRQRPAPPPRPSRPDEPVWAGPGSGEPAPRVRIRADLAGTAADRQPEPPPRRASRPEPDDEEGDGDGGGGGQERRSRPLRAR